MDRSVRVPVWGAIDKSGSKSEGGCGKDKHFFLFYSHFGANAGADPGGRSLKLEKI